MFVITYEFVLDQQTYVQKGTSKTLPFLPVTGPCVENTLSRYRFGCLGGRTPRCGTNAKIATQHDQREPTNEWMDE